MRAKPEPRARSARELRAKPESRALCARELRAKFEQRAKPEIERGKGLGRGLGPGCTCQGGGVLGVVSLTKFENVCKSFKFKICKSYYVSAFVSLDDSKVCIWQELKCSFEHRNYVFPFQSSRYV